MTGSIAIVGIGPGDDMLITPQVTAALAEATDVFGYIPYVARIAARDGLTLHASDNREELDRAAQALEAAARGGRVVVVSSGDPGVFAMAAAVFEALEAGPAHWRDLYIQVMPGITAMLAASARAGAPLGHDFCAISLSDNLKPWDVVARRLSCAAEGDFVIALYNPASKARPRRVHDAFALLRSLKAGATPVAFARAVGRADEKLTLTTLHHADPGLADMATLVMIGSSDTRWVARDGARPWMLTPRSYGAGR